MSYCQNHPETPAVAYCRTCGKPMCEECKRATKGAIYCEEHAPAVPVPTPVIPHPPMEARHDASPALAFVLGFIPGVGAIYNGQYAKGLVHAIIFGLLVSILSSGAASNLEPLMGVLLSTFIFYMAFEAHHTAHKRQAGEPVDEFSSLMNLGGRPGTFPVGALVLIGLGVILLLDTMDILQFRYLARYWPVLLIVAGVYKLFARMSPGESESEREVGHEHR